MNYKLQMDKILQNRTKNPEKFLQLIHDMRRELHKDKKLNQEELSAMRIFTDTYLCESYLISGKIKEAQELGEKAIKKQLRKGHEDMLQILYNLLGYAYGCMGDYVGASTCFYSGIELASKHDDYEMLRILYSNFAISYMKLNEYEKAKQLIDKSYDMLLKAPNSEEEKEIALKNYSELLSEYYFGIKEYEKGLSLLEINNPQYVIKSASAYLAQGNIKEAEQAMIQFMQADTPVSNPVTQFEIYHAVIDIALKLENPAFSDICLEKMLASAKKCDISNFWVTYFEYQIKVCEHFDREPASDLYENFYRYHEDISAQREKNECTYIINELDIFTNNLKQRELEKKNERLVQISMIDELTKVYNRAGFQNHFSELFSSALSRQIPLGLCMIDLDFFKEVNDHFGHLTGDTCLKNVAKAIKASFGKEAVVCRFGGDEFIVITLGFSDEQFEASLKRLVHHNSLKTVISRASTIADSGTKQPDTALTLSIGAVNCVPTNGATDTDYIYTADNLLYLVKRDTRNAYRMATRLS